MSIHPKNRAYNSRSIKGLRGNAHLKMIATAHPIGNFQSTILDNGLPILTVSMPHAQSVSAVFLIGAGSRYEDHNLAGASHFLEHLLFKGTRRWPNAKALSEAIEGVGGFFNASTDKEITAYWCKVAYPFFSQIIEVLSDMILSPTIDKKEMEKERAVIIEELNMSNDHPDYRASLILDETLWPNQPMGRDVGGTRESVSGLSRETIVRYMKRQYSPINSVVAIAGNVTHEEVMAHIGQTFQTWTPTTPLPWSPAQRRSIEPRVRVEYRKTEQAHLCLGIPTIQLNHQDRYALDILNVILGEGMSSRLFTELRENRGLAYEVYSELGYYRDCGFLAIYSGVELSKSEQALESILNELRTLRNEPVSVRELRKAQEYYKGRLLLHSEDTRGVAMRMGAQRLLLGQVYPLEQVISEIDAINPEDVHRIARNVFDTEQLTLAIVGPYRSATRFEKQLKL